MPMSFITNVASSEVTEVTIPKLLTNAPRALANSINPIEKEFESPVGGPNVFVQCQ